MSNDRRVEQALTIDAPVDAVWNALTDATELTRWFPLDASVVPGAGGVIRMRWDEGYDADSAIEIWEPGRHLRIGFPHHPPVLLATDYHLESDKGRTTLRVVTSGFGEGTDWDDWFAGVRAGWDFELRGLKHYLEHHRGQDRLVASARQALSIPRESAWERLTGPGGWLERTGLTGATLFRSPPVQLVMTVDQLNNGLLRIELEFGNRVIAWLATWGASPAAVKAINAEWQRTLPAALT
jgi:uncharacterized protein YndB with AHSA1/START domain